jgi:cell wall-associated NlpC family hydrolase
VRFRSSVRRAVLAAGVGALIVSGVAPAAQAAPRDLQQVRNQVRDFQAQAESATERYNEAQVRLSDIQSDLESLERKVTREKRNLGEISAAVDELARSAYTTGGVDTSLQVLLADDPNEFLAQAAALDQVAMSQASSLRKTQTARLRLAQAEAELKQKQDSAKSVRNEMKDAKEEANERLNAAEGVLSGLEAEERARIAQLAAKERKAALAAAAAAARQIDQSQSQGQQSGPSAGGGGFSGGGRAATAVRYALAQVGDRYVAATAGPNTFDCSGLTMTAWRQAGISLPHYSYSQYSKSRKIPLSQAQPGDLIFYFGGSVHHVGMYIGNGKMVHAANPDEGVVITDVLGPWYNRYFTGVGRVLG